MTTSTPTPFLTPDALLRHWQGHRNLTRRVIEAFPEDKLFSFSVGGMRPFGDLALEMLAMAAPMAKGVATEEWQSYALPESRTKQDLLDRWDASTKDIDQYWAQIPAERFQQRMTAFGQYEGAVPDLMMYVVDNEIHHRGQGYVYLRALGIEPPAFYERS